MIRLRNEPHDIDVHYDWEESDRLIASTLSVETEQRLLEMAREIRESLMNSLLAGNNPMEDLQVRLEQSLLRGKYEILLQLVADSKEAKATQHLI